MTSEATFDTQQMPRRTTRVLLAVGFLLAVGALIGFATRSGQNAPRLDVSLINLDVGEPSRVAAGPGGFIRIGDTVQFSPDGVEWNDVMLPGARPSQRITSTSRLRVESTDTLWMIHRIRSNRTVVWTSSDAESWDRDVVEGDWTALRSIDGTGGGFVAQTRNPVAYFWSRDGKAWSESTPPLDAMPGTQLLADISHSGLTLMRLAPQVPVVELSHTADGTSWTTGAIDHTDLGAVGEVGVHTVEHIGDNWIAIGSVVDATTRPRTVDVAVWTSADGEEWDYSNSPDLMPSGGYLAAPLSMGDAIVVPVVAESRISHWWATTDGIVWDSVGFPIDMGVVMIARNSKLNTVAGRSNGDGTYTIVYSGGSGPGSGRG